MKLFSVTVLCFVAALLAACSDKRASTCIAGNHFSQPVEGLSDIDRYFVGTDFNKHVGSTLGELAKGFPTQYEGRVAIVQSANLVGVKYKFSYTMDVHFSELKYTKFDTKKNTWDFARVNKETVSGIKVTYGGYCKEFGKLSY